ncbi:MAG: DUF357 domain-containing protein [Candidatus Marsarchaeota archaeon]|nr:DUF357 domain-containing protein [Candidatus Marsarchaeota archaeon]MCL5413152.1 DUF357 domain-containing protein [Candidatus Marsarchaeota archaeon]
MELEDRVKRTVAIFNENVSAVAGLNLTEAEVRVVELAKMYASDTSAFIKNGDYVTAFSAIEYAHGLLDAIIKIKKG